MKKLFIFEGPDGCGKSTQVELFAKKLTALGKKVKVTREPGGTEVGELIRNILLNSEHDLSLETQAYLFATARRLHNEQIAEWINEGYTVICDRHILSSLAYQSADTKLKSMEQDEKMENIMQLNKMAMEPISKLIFDPQRFSAISDCQIIYFNISPETMLARAKKRVEDRGLDNIEKKYTSKKDSVELLERYNLGLKKLKKLDIAIIDANKSIEEVHQDVIELL